MSQVPYDQLTDHEYDGIQEYDNPTPGWWHWIFWLTVLFAFPYFLIYHFGDMGWKIEDAYKAEQVDALQRQFHGITLKGDAATILKYIGDKNWGVIGESTFQQNCAKCHGSRGEGVSGSGPNMTDDYYKNIKVPTDFVRVITDGVPGTAMPSWGKQLDQNTLVLVASYVAGLRGKNVPGQPPYGEIIPAWPKIEASSDPASAPAKP